METTIQRISAKGDEVMKKNEIDVFVGQRILVENFDKRIFKGFLLEVQDKLIILREKRGKIRILLSKISDVKLASNNSKSGEHGK